MRPATWPSTAPSASAASRTCSGPTSPSRRRSSSWSSSSARWWPHSSASAWGWSRSPAGWPRCTPSPTSPTSRPTPSTWSSSSGSGVAIDYSLFIVSRFREELRRQASVEAALAVTMRTAGTAVAYSGITVAVGATALLFYSGHHPHQHGAVGQLHGPDRGGLRALLPPRPARHPRRAGEPLAAGQPAAPVPAARGQRPRGRGSAARRLPEAAAGGSGHGSPTW